MVETDATSSEALLAQVALGSRDAFDALYRSTANRLFGICLRVLAERSEAEDALQEVFTTVWRKAAQFDATKASATTWLAMIARNKAIDRLRSTPARQARRRRSRHRPPRIARSSRTAWSGSSRVAARSSAPPSSTGSPMRSWRRRSKPRWAPSRVGFAAV